ncbi:hypothetical protein [uncultured Aquimarina sp.]|uniref:hypothetical protein n=1 Tax=uncultured Aquimarina sp. TaxID=575652 RepID=UPI0026395026|nr:hypothetical protein [uncultured Aquimarina sp.]
MKIFKIVVKVLLGLIIVFVLFLFGVYYFKIGRYNVDDQKYPYYIGYLNPQNTFSPEGFILCGDKEAVYKTHHGAPKIAYSPNKGIYDRRIRSNFFKNRFNDSGYINFRFIVNCKGEPGRFETIQTNLNLEETSHNSDLVRHLLELTSNPENWNIFIHENQPRNYYTYISYKIEHGEITEILP